MAFYRSPYEQIYGHEMFDTIHNFFPEIMYDDSMFGGEINNWLRYRMNMVFPVTWQSQQTLYFGTRAEPIREEFHTWRRSQFPGAHQNIVSLQLPQPRVQRPRVRRFNRVLRTTPETDNIMVSIIASSNIFQDSEDAMWRRFEEDVEVAATEEQITAASEILAHSSVPATTNCAICQDHDSQIAGENWRKLFCTHAFHISCIDSWFGRNVHCPVCRKDIRDEQ